MSGEIRKVSFGPVTLSQDSLFTSGYFRICRVISDRVGLFHLVWFCRVW